MIGTLLNERYRLKAELGRGGMGVVYRARDTVLDRDVAVKVLSSSGLGTEGRGRLLREAQAAAGLNHPNIVTVHDVGEADGAGPAGPMPFIVMELVEGPSLHERRPDTLEEILVVARQVCAALEHAHAKGIVHRDLKPENVLLALDPLAGTGASTGTVATAKLSDFGLARSIATRLSAEGVVVGTVFHLAPELALGHAYDGRADLYSLGVTLYELTTGRLPFMADDPVAVISQHLHAPVVPPRAKDAEIPPALDALILRLLSKDPQGRPASAAEVQRALEATDILDREAAPARELSVLERIERGRLVARERELAEARAIWRKASAGEGGMLLVSGEPGIGKTRLVRELCTEVQVGGDRVLVGECYAESGAPYAPFAQILRRAFRDGAGEDLAAALPDFVLADLLTLAPSLRLRFPDVPPNPSLDPKSDQQRLFENMVACCGALCERTPVLLVLEDAHWADSGSLALLRHLARRTRHHRVLIVATYREVELDQTRPFQEVLLDLNRERLATRLRLTRLDREGTHDMLGALFAEEIRPESLRSEFLEGIYAETEGNPFFIEEVCKALVESGQVSFAGGAWDRPGMEELEIPQGVRVAIQSRVAKMPPDCQEMLRLAAVLGREFEFETLLAASDPSTLQLRSGQAQGEEGLIEALEYASRAQLVTEVSAEQDVTFAFTHALIPATLSEGVSTLRRRRLHRRAAAAIERLHPDDFESLAYHYSEAGDEERALAYHTKAGARASAAYANVEAEEHYRVALELVETEPERAGLLWELGRALNRQSKYEEALEIWQEGIAAYQALGEQDGVARLSARSARAAWLLGDTPRGLAICREGMAAVAGAPESPDQADLLHETARACHFNGLPDEAAPLCRRALEMAERLGDVRVQAEALTTLGVLPSVPYEEAVLVLSQAIELAESAGLLDQAGRAHNNLGSAHAFLEVSREHFLRAAELDRERGEIAGEFFSLCNAADASLGLGDLAAAEGTLPTLHRLADAAGRPSFMMTTRMRGLDVMLLRYRGELAEAVEGLQSFRAEAREAGDLQSLAEANAQLIFAYLSEGLGDEEEIEATLHELADLGERGMGTGVLAQCMRGLRRARQGEPEMARHLLARAREQATEQGELMLWESYLLWATAHVAQLEGQWPEALAAFEATFDALGDRRLRWYQARILIDWAEAHLARGELGDRERGLELLREAEAEFEAMGAHGYVERVKGDLAQWQAS